MTELTRRNDFVNRSFDVFFDYYSREPYRSRIDAMGQLGINSSALDIVLNPETYVYLPANNETTHEMPFDDSSNCIGVVAVNPGEAFWVTVGFHPLQIPKTPDTYTGSSELPSGAGASVFNPLVKQTFTDTDEARYLYRRPTLILPYEGRQHEYSTVLVHELTHIAQMLTRSVRVYKDSETGELDRLVDDYNNELDAYHMQEKVFGGDFVSFIMDATMSTSAATESYRRRELRATNGYVTRGNLDALQRDKTVGTIVRRGYIDENPNDIVCQAG